MRYCTKKTTYRLLQALMNHLEQEDDKPASASDVEEMRREIANSILLDDRRWHSGVTWRDGRLVLEFWRV